MLAVKKKRLANLAGRKYISDRALADILHTLQEDAAVDASLFPGLSSRSSARSVEHEIQISTVYGVTLQNINLETRGHGVSEWTYINPFAMLNLFTAKVPSFGRLLRLLARRNPSSSSHPREIALYNDEASPGNLLRRDNTRKTETL